MGHPLNFALKDKASLAPPVLPGKRLALRRVAKPPCHSLFFLLPPASSHLTDEAGEAHPRRTVGCLPGSRPEWEPLQVPFPSGPEHLAPLPLSSASLPSPLSGPQPSSSKLPSTRESLCPPRAQPDQHSQYPDAQVTPGSGLGLQGPAQSGPCLLPSSALLPHC